MTKDYFIICDLPIEFNPQKAMQENLPVFQANMDGVCRYGFLRRDADNSDDIIWITSPVVHFAYHYVNAFQNGDKITLHGCIWDKLNFDMNT